MVCLDGCFVSILFSKADVVISVANVKLGEQCLALEFVHCFSYSWHRVMVSYSPGIHPSVVDDDTFFSTIFLANEEDRGNKLRWSFFDLSQCLLLFKPHFFDFSFCLRTWIWFTFNRGGCIGKEFNRYVWTVVWGESLREFFREYSPMTPELLWYCFHCHMHAFHFLKTIPLLS